MDGCHGRLGSPDRVVRCSDAVLIPARRRRLPGLRNTDALRLPNRSRSRWAFSAALASISSMIWRNRMAGLRVRCGLGIYWRGTS